MKNNNGELKVCVPDDIDKIKRTIKAFKNESGDNIFGVSIIRQDKKHYLKRKNN